MAALPEQVIESSPPARVSVFSAAAHLKKSLHIGPRTTDESDSSSTEPPARPVNPSKAASAKLEKKGSKEVLCNAPSGIPTDIQVPELAFGEQISAARHDRPDIMPFSTYAPCRLLDVDPDSPVGTPHITPHSHTGSSISCVAHSSVQLG